MFIRGVEGGIIPSLQQSGRLFYYYDRGEEQQRDMSPKDIAIKANKRAVPIPTDLPSVAKVDAIAASVNSDALAQYAAELGLAALGGKTGMTYDSLVYSAATCLVHLGHCETMPTAAEAVRKILDSGAALERLKAAC